MSQAPPIPTGRLDSTLFPPERQFQSWANHSHNTRMFPINDGGFRAQGAFWELAGVVVAESHLDPFVAERDEAMIAATRTDHLLVVALIQGSVCFEGSGFRQDCDAYDVFICDYARPSRMTAYGVHCATVYLARDFLEQVAGPVQAHGLLPRSAETQLLRSVLKSLPQILPFAAAASIGHYARMLRDLVAAALVGLPHVPATGGTQHERARAQAYIAAQPPGTLTIAAMTGALGATRSTLYKLFKPDGGVLAYERTRRLRTLYRQASDPAETRSLSVLGAAQGFLDSAVLARAFRARFGCSLSEVRRRARASEPPASWPPAMDRLRRSISRLSGEGEG